jgi:hypothetical protein
MGTKRNVADMQANRHRWRKIIGSRWVRDGGSISEHWRSARGGTRAMKNEKLKMKNAK